MAAPKDLSFLANRGAQTVQKRGIEYFYRQISAARALKVYRCPGCNNDILPNVSHVVAWEAEGLFGQEVAINNRRHWHTHCWNIA